MPKSPYVVMLPPDLAKALHTRPTLAVIFQGLPVAEQRRHVELIRQAILVDEKRRRISNLMQELTDMAK